MAEIIQVCKVTKESFKITEAEQDHIRKFESLHPLLNVGDIPLPTIHPQENIRQMQSYVTLTALFNAKSSISGKELITRYNPQLGYRMCTYDEFWSDVVDNTKYGKEYDFSRPFFDQVNDLMHRVYMQPLVQINCEKSPYVDASSNLQNCYMCFGVGESQDCLYCLKSRYPLRNRDCVDCIGIIDCELCYSCVNTENCYNCQHCQDCSNSHNCFGSYDLIGCANCFGCYGLRHQEFFIFNQKVSPIEYNEFMGRANLSSYQSRQFYIRECEAFLIQAPKVNTIKFSEQSTGRYLSHCKNVYECYLAENLEDCGWSTGARGADCWRSEVMEGELAYNSVQLFGRLGLGNSIHTGSENFYSYMIFDSNSCFGSVMLKKKSYCILNKQYSREEYYNLVPRIISHMKSTGEWGQFFPPQYAPHFYQESQSSSLCKSISSEELQRRGYRLMNTLTEDWSHHATMRAADLPDSFTEKEINSLLRHIVNDSNNNKYYCFDRRELVFYHKQGIPLPRVHWEKRLMTLMEKTNTDDRKLA